MKNDAKHEEKLTVQKLTWGIWQFLSRALKNVKNLHFSLFLKKIYVWARKVRKSTENESLLVLSKHEELGKFSTVERFILDSKMAELNENKNSKQCDRPMQWENFVLP